ncbi:Uncharacterised protein [Chlamydia trachomatis]|nr:Uncharacterised protein [Chlamydia trachomatis]
MALENTIFPEDKQVVSAEKATDEGRQDTTIFDSISSTERIDKSRTDSGIPINGSCHKQADS